MGAVNARYLAPEVNVEGAVYKPFTKRTYETLTLSLLINLAFRRRSFTSENFQPFMSVN
jgi:hypothetical protein